MALAPCNTARTAFVSFVLTTVSPLERYAVSIVLNGVLPSSTTCTATVLSV